MRTFTEYLISSAAVFAVLGAILVQIAHSLTVRKEFKSAPGGRHPGSWVVIAPPCICEPMRSPS